MRPATALQGRAAQSIEFQRVEVVLAQRRLKPIDLLSEEGRFDFDASQRVWGGDS